MELIVQFELRRVYSAITASAVSELLMLTMLRPRSLYLSTFIGYLRYKILLKSKHVSCTRSLRSLGIRKVYACVFWPGKSTMRMLFKQKSLKLMIKFINLR